jgi:hypothetical protein
LTKIITNRENTFFSSCFSSSRRHQYKHQIWMCIKDSCLQTVSGYFPDSSTTLPSSMASWTLRTINSNLIQQQFISEAIVSGRVMSEYLHATMEEFFAGKC